MADARFRMGVARLGALGYSYDSWLYYFQIPELIDLARVLGETTFILDHLGAPLMLGSATDGGSVRSHWRNLMIDLSHCPNVIVKVGGFGIDRIFSTGWSSRELRPSSDEVVARFGADVRWCIDTFGPSRCMFESNYPVDRACLGYNVIWNAFQKIAAQYSETEQDELFAGTAARVYRIR
jgi:predicted TIM-barrel fold metal-dependent hydrolase